MENFKNLKEWQRMLSALSESVFDATEEELREELRVSGEDFNRTAERTRQLFSTTIEKYRKRNLAAAAEQYQRQKEAMENRTYSLPASPQERRQLLGAILTRNPQIGKALLTIQHRDFKDLPDADVESALKQLKELGIEDCEDLQK